MRLGDTRVLVRAAGSAAVILMAAAGAGNAAADSYCGFSGGNAAHGSVIFHQTCIVCHGADGKGVIPGAPDFTKKGGGVLSKPHKYLQAHIENGFQDPNSPMAMPPRGGNPGLSDQDIRDVHEYLHKTFGCGK